MSETGFIKWLREIRLDDVPRVGGKTASLGELYGELGAAGVRVPNGFAITAAAYRALLDGDGLRDRAREHLERGHRRGRGGAGHRRRPPARARRVGPAAARARGGDRRRLPDARARVRRRARGGGSIERHRGGPAAGELRRPARELSGGPGRDRAARRVPALLRLDLHRPRHRLSPPERLRSPERGPVDRGPEDGRLRPGQLGSHVHARSRQRVPRRGARSTRPGASARRSCRASSIRTSSGSSSRRSGRATTRC